MKTSPRLLVVLLAASASHANAQIPLYTLQGGAALEHFGSSAAWIGDVNLDGRPDFAAGGPFPNAGQGPGVVRVCSGPDGSVLRVLNGLRVGDAFGADVAPAGDVDADGVPDLIVGARHVTNTLPNSGMAQVFSGATGVVLHTFRPSTLMLDESAASVAGIGDVNGDGRDDLLVGRSEDPTGGSSAGSATVYSGLDGSVLRVHIGVAGQQLGEALANLGDIDGDLRDDYAFGGSGSLTFAQPGFVQVRSGATGAVLYTIARPTYGDRFGTSIASVLDVDGDARPDFAVGAPSDSVAHGAGGAAYVYSGASGAELRVVRGTGTNHRLGERVAAALDADGDDVPDLLVSVPGHVYFTGSARAKIFSGATGALLHDLRSYVSDDDSGRAIGGGADVDGDGIPEFLVGAPRTNVPPFQSRHGALRLISLVSPIENYCRSITVPNSTGLRAGLSGTGFGNQYENNLVLEVRHLPPGTPVLFFTGTAAASVPLGGSVLCVGGTSWRLGAAQPASASGTASRFVNTLPSNPIFQAGTTWHFQTWFRDGASTNMSTAIAVPFWRN